MKISFWIALLVVFIVGVGLFLTRATIEQRHAYRELKALAQGEQQAATTVVCQRRRGISKLFIAGGSGERRRLALNCATAQLVLRRENSRTELVEEMDGVEAQWQEALYSSPPLWCRQLAFGDACQLVRQFTADHALYYPRRRSVLAGGVTWQQMLAEGHLLPCCASTILQRGKATEMAVQPSKGGPPRWRARGLSLEETTWMP